MINLQEFESIGFLNLLLALAAMVVNLIYAWRCNRSWRWLKLCYGINAGIIAAIYIRMLFFEGTVSAWALRLGMTLILITILAGGILSLISCRDEMKGFIEEK